MNEKNIYKSMGIHIIINIKNNIIKTNIQGIKGIIEMNYIYNYIIRLYYIYYFHLENNYK